MPGFDQAAYWRKRGRDYFGRFRQQAPRRLASFAAQEAALRAALAGLAGEVSSVLEIGCGFGRITEIALGTLPGVRRYLALDISSEQLAHARELLSGKHAVEPELLAADFTALPEGERFDLVLAAEVFLHFPPARIGAVLAKALRLADKYVVHVDPYIPRPADTPLAMLRRLVVAGTAHRWDWDHDYPRLYDQARVSSVEILPIEDGDPQRIFIVRKR